MEAIIRTGNIENEKWNSNRVETVKHMAGWCDVQLQAEVKTKDEFYSLLVHTYVNK